MIPSGIITIESVLNQSENTVFNIITELLSTDINGLHLNISV